MHMGCFLIGITGPGFTRSGEALLGSISDNPYDIRTFLRVGRPNGALTHLGSGLTSTTELSMADRGYLGTEQDTWRGVNERGLAFNCAMVYEAEGPEKKPDAVLFTKITKKIMDQCETVEAALELFLQAGAVHPAFSVLIADAQGGLAHVEAGNFGISVNHRFSKENPGAVFAVNCYLSKKLMEYNAILARLENSENNNRVRRERGIQFLEEIKGSADVSAIARLLSDHENRERDPTKNPLEAAWGFSICNHGTRHQDGYPPEDLPWGTVSAEILQPAEKTLWYAYGWPCGESPEYGDQIFQNRSWGKFLPFALNLEYQGKNEYMILSTPEGELTPGGRKYLASF